MARISLEASYALRCRVWELYGVLSLRGIAKELGISLGSVQNYLSVPPENFEPAINALTKVVTLKASPANAHRGSLELQSMAGASSVSRRTIERRVKPMARKGIYRSSKRAPYHTEAKPTAYGDMWQMDTKKLRVGSSLLTLLVCRDVYTGCTVAMHYSATQVGMLHKVSTLFNIFGGVPTVFQVDNGTTDFSMPSRSKLRPWHNLAFARGVERVQFIPEAEPRRNGSVESWNDWLQDEWDNHAAYHGVDLDNFDDWLAERLRYYNYQKPLSSTGSIPAALSGGLFNLDVDVPVNVSYSKPSTGCISFIRYVSRSVDRETGAIVCVSPIKSPGTVFVVPNEFEGGYLRFDWHLDGRGVVVAPREVDIAEAIKSGEKSEGRRYVARRNPGLVIGSFVSPLVNPSAQVVQIDVLPQVASLFTAVVTDPTMIARVWKKILKQAIPEILPDHIQLKVGRDGDWEAWSGSDLIWTEQSSPAVIEHAREDLNA